MASPPRCRTARCAHARLTAQLELANVSAARRGNPPPSPRPWPPCAASSGGQFCLTHSPDLGAVIYTQRSQECCAACANTPGCAGWMYIPSLQGEGSCHRKSKVFGRSGGNCTSSCADAHGNPLWCILSATQRLRGNRMISGALRAGSIKRRSMEKMNRSTIWKATNECVYPRLLLVLYGQLRSFEFTADALLHMANFVSKECFFLVAVTEDKPCTEKPNGTCAAVKGHVMRIPNMSNIERALMKFENHNIVYYPSEQTYLANAARKVSGIWRARVSDTVTNTISSLFKLIPRKSTLVIRTRFDMYPVTVPKNLGAVPLHHKNQPILYASDLGDCQPDLFMYASLGVMMERRFPMWFESTSHLSLCPATSGVLTMETDWKWCRRHLIRSQPTRMYHSHYTNVSNARLYCNCSATERLSGFDPIKRRWNRFTYHLSHNTTYECPGSFG